MTVSVFVLSLPCLPCTSCLVKSGLEPHPVLSCPAISWSVLFCPSSSWPVLSCRVWTCYFPVLAWSTACFSAMSCSAMPFTSLPLPTLSCWVPPCRMILSHILHCPLPSRPVLYIQSGCVWVCPLTSWPPIIAMSGQVLSYFLVRRALSWPIISFPALPLCLLSNRCPTLSCLRYRILSWFLCYRHIVSIPALSYCVLSCPVVLLHVLSCFGWSSRFQVYHVHLV